MKTAWILVVAAIINGEPVIQPGTGQEAFRTQSQCLERARHPVIRQSYEQDYWPGQEVILYCKREKTK